MTLLALDRRWQALLAAGGPIDIGCDEPSLWPHGARGDAPVLRVQDDQLAADLCRMGDARLLRCTLTLPILGADESVGFALWAEVDHPTFYAYLDLLDGGAPPALAPAKLANGLGDHIALQCPIILDFGDGSARPAALLTPMPPLSLDALMTLYAQAGIAL